MPVGRRAARGNAARRHLAYVGKVVRVFVVIQPIAFGAVVAALMALIVVVARRRRGGR